MVLDFVVMGFVPYASRIRVWRAQRSAPTQVVLVVLHTGWLFALLTLRSDLARGRVLIRDREGREAKDGEALVAAWDERWPE